MLHSVTEHALSAGRIDKTLTNLLKANLGARIL